MAHPLLTLGTLPIDTFALAGGGGSSGGGGGGGGGFSGSGGSDGGDILAIIIGFLPMYAIGILLAKASHNKTALKVLANIIGWTIATIYLIFLANAMGGFLGTLYGLAGFAGMAAGLYSVLTKIKRGISARKQLQAAAAQDSAWDENTLTNYAKATFLKYQQDWSKLDTEAMKAYLTPNYHYHATLLVSILKLMGRKNIVEDVVITEATIVSINDSADNNQDRFTILISGYARDQLVEAVDNSSLFTNTSTFTEYWHFVRNDKTWLLDSISQSTADAASVNKGLVDVAMKYGYRYSEDMGWLFIPKRGQLFSEARFGTSDINNHIVGMYDGRLLVQVYSYVAKPTENSAAYVIAQVSVPKQYGNIVVRRKKMLQLGIRGLERVETEWTKFNNKYEVFASGYEQATSFELLNPTYMEQLEALPFEVNIEVVDNVIYLYTSERGSDAATYETMLDILDKAFKEMRL